MVFTVVDIETTGLSKYYHRITEIAAARVRDGKIVKSYQTLVNPQVSIPSFITRLTGIDNKMVKNAPLISEALPSFVEFIGEDVFVAHCAAFDYGFIEFNLKRRHNHDIINKRLCTRKLANRLFPELPAKRLTDLCSHLNVVNINAHRAMGDVEATSQVFIHMLDILQKKGICSVDDILRFERSKVIRRV